jgi:hypothetical protein
LAEGEGMGSQCPIGSSKKTKKTVIVVCLCGVPIHC